MEKGAMMHVIAVMSAILVIVNVVKEDAVVVCDEVFIKKSFREVVIKVLSKEKLS